jgi:hypothetical protein
LTEFNKKIIKIMAKFINESPFQHTCRYGTKFDASRCDFAGGVIVSNIPTKELLAMDMAEMIGYHACAIHPDLNGFQGYDCISFDFHK